MSEQGPEATLAAALAQATDTRRVVVAPGALGEIGRVIEECFGDAPVVVIADDTTYQVAGSAVEAHLRGSGRDVRPAILLRAPSGGVLHADYDYAVWLREQLASDHAVPVAVGSGTVNDLTKLAAHMLERPYMVVATAASMDGYAAFGAAITHEGFKHSMACPAPRAVVADETILAAAPGALTGSGFGDLAGKVTAGADWIVADALGVEPIDESVWQMVQPAVGEALAAAKGVSEGEPAAVARLFRCLVMSGLAMQAARSSRPASGAEHQLSHLWEMQGVQRDGHEASHGFKVGVGTVAIAALYERLLARDLTQIDVDAVCAKWPSLAVQEDDVRRRHTDARQQERALEELRAKYVAPEQLRERLERVRVMWPELHARLRRQLLPADELRGLLRTAGCPTEPEEIGLAAGELVNSLVAARQIRRRYTVLDLAAEAGLFETLSSELGAGGTVKQEDASPARGGRSDGRSRVAGARG